MFQSPKIILFMLVLMLVLVACGGVDANSTPRPTATAFPTFEFVAPTNPPAFEATSEVDAETEATPDARLIDRGLGRYDSLDCATCHGENGEGTDEAQALSNLGLSETDFISFMRSGGDIGSEHQYSTDRLSENGARNLYLYLISLADSEN